MPRKYPKVEIGQVFGKWTVVGEAGRNNHNRVLLCRCECGHESNVREYSLRGGSSSGCKFCRARKGNKNSVAANTRHRTTDLGFETSVADAARVYGINPGTAVSRASRGRDPFATGERGSLVVNGEVMGFGRAARLIGIPLATIRARRRRGWTLPQALGIEPPPPRRRRK